MIKKIILSVGLLISLHSYSQEGTSSPYSYFGLGKDRFRGTQDQRAMGGLAIEGDSIAMNLQNPASYSHLRLTAFAIGGTTNFTTMKNETTSEKATRTTIDYLAIGIPMGKFGAAIGLKPYSSVGYKFQNSFTDDSGYPATKKFTGTGNINNFFGGVSYNINNNFSVGSQFEYNFGTIENEIIESHSQIRLSTRENNTAQVKGFNFNLGLLYNKKLSNGLKLNGSFTFSPETKLSVSNSRNIATAAYSSSGTEYTNDSQDITIPDYKATVPAKYSFGAGIGKQNSWLVGAQVILQNNSKLINLSSANTAGSFENAQTYIVGGYFIPKYDSFSSYFSRIVYRAGFRYNKTGLVLYNESINDYGMNFGLGLPLGVSKIDLGFEFGKTGTTANGLIQENYFNVSVGFSIADKWFRKNLID